MGFWLRVRSNISFNFAKARLRGAWEELGSFPTSWYIQSLWTAFFLFVCLFLGQGGVVRTLLVMVSLQHCLLSGSCDSAIALKWSHQKCPFPGIQSISASTALISVCNLITGFELFQAAVSCFAFTIPSRTALPASPALCCETLNPVLLRRAEGRGWLRISWRAGSVPEPSVGNHVQKPRDF